MALQIVRQRATCCYQSLFRSRPRRFSSLYEPDYLETGKPKTPVYPVLNVQIKGYVYPVLEKYQGFIHKVAESFDFDIDDSFALPPKCIKVERFKAKTTKAEAEFNLKLFERNIQVSEITGVRCPIFVRVLEAALPEGVSLKVEVFDLAYEEKRYVPDKKLLDLKSELHVIVDGKKKN